MFFNKNYKSCEIYRKKFKSKKNFVVVGLKKYGKRVKRRTNGFAKDFVRKHRNCKCPYCNKKLTLKNATADHIVPVSKGGNNCQVNLVVCCKKCNTQRGDSSIRDFLKSKKINYKNFI